MRRTDWDTGVETTRPSSRCRRPVTTSVRRWVYALISKLTATDSDGHWFPSAHRAEPESGIWSAPGRRRERRWRSGPQDAIGYWPVQHH